jgi:hypothetical protein
MAGFFTTKVTKIYKIIGFYFFQQAQRPLFIPYLFYRMLYVEQLAKPQKA